MSQTEVEYWLNVVKVLNKYSNKYYELTPIPDEIWELKVDGQIICEDARRFLARVCSPR